MKSVPVVLSALVGAGLVAAAGNVMMDGTDPFVRPQISARLAPSAMEVTEDVPADADQIDVRTVNGRTVEGRTVDEPGLRVRDVALVVNDDGSAAVGASAENGNDTEVALVGVVVSVDGQRRPVNSTEMWLPVPAGQRSTVGAASDAGGFVVPRGIRDAMRADIEFWFDDGTCVLADVTAVARTDQHRMIYPRSAKPIGPVTTDERPAGTTSCSDN